jgi:hypothetical protein
MCWWSPQLEKDVVIDSMVFKLIFILNIEFRKSHTIKGDAMYKLQCVTICSNTHKNILKP